VFLSPTLLLLRECWPFSRWGRRPDWTTAGKLTRPADGKRGALVIAWFARQQTGGFSPARAAVSTHTGFLPGQALEWSPQKRNARIDVNVA
jgi:hypothetical protein